ncbi:MAG: peptidylprolyl isomerase [Thermodesulfobacteriota bacterium]|nr:peptidylprolyl isomerase [Thermodesulfobacteriota bacterium]
MASNFRIYCHQNRENLHLKLMGDFDGTSAYELINILKKYRGIAGRVFIHTCFLSSVHSFGLDVFQKNCAIKKLSRILTFTGKYGNKLAPHGSILLKPNPDKLEKLQVN